MNVRWDDNLTSDNEELNLLLGNQFASGVRKISLQESSKNEFLGGIGILVNQHIALIATIEVRCKFRCLARQHGNRLDLNEV